MPNYLHKAGGTLEGGFPWSIGMVSTSSDSEAAAQSVWDSGVVAMFTSASFHALVPTGTTLTYTSTSTASATFKQTTKTENSHSTAGTATQGLPFQAGGGSDLADSPVHQVGTRPLVPAPRRRHGAGH
jgi:hypothetical protein